MGARVLGLQRVCGYIFARVVMMMAMAMMPLKPVENSGNNRGENWVLPRFKMCAKMKSVGKYKNIKRKVTMERKFYLVKAVKQCLSGSWYYFPVADLVGDCDPIMFQMLDAYNKEDMREYKAVYGSLNNYFKDQGIAIYLVCAEDEEKACEVAKTKHEGKIV